MSDDKTFDKLAQAQNPDDGTIEDASSDDALTLTRRQFIGATTGFVAAAAIGGAVAQGSTQGSRETNMTNMTDTAPRFGVIESVLGPAPQDPWAERDVTFTAPDGSERVVPAFSRGGRWVVRYASGLVGEHRWRSGGAEGVVTITEGLAEGGRLAHGPLVVSADRRHLEHADGTPFLWLADTWWHAFVSVKCSDAEFAGLAAQRAAQGFSVVQLVAGLPCEVEPFGEANRARAGWAWEPGFTALNPAWWDDADARVGVLLGHDLMPCILGSWGFHLSQMTTAQLTRHWREMVARWGAYPVVWCLAGEPQNVWYEDLAAVLGANTGALLAGQGGGGGNDASSEAGAAEAPPSEAAIQLGKTRALQLRTLNELARVVRDLEPFGRPVTTHTVPGTLPWELLDDAALVDFWFLQTGHFGYSSLAPTMDALRQALAYEPTKPVVNGEVNYEGIAGTSWEDIQRFLFWGHMMSGLTGFSYGAHGVWAFNTHRFPGQFSGLAPRWQEAARFTGGAHVGTGRKILSRYPWHELQPATDVVTPHSTPENIFQPYAGRLPDGRRLVYFPSLAYSGGFSNPTLLDLGSRPWQAVLIDLTTGEPQPPFTVTPNADGTGTMPGLFSPLPSWSDWVLELRLA